MARKKILVIGANGFTGRRIQDDLSRNLSYQTTGCSLHDDIRPHSGDYRFIRTDICNRQAVEKLFQEVQPDVVINTSALSVPDYCETHHAEADAVNITAVEMCIRDRKHTMQKQMPSTLLPWSIWQNAAKQKEAASSIFPQTLFSAAIRIGLIRKKITKSCHVCCCGISLSTRQV